MAFSIGMQWCTRFTRLLATDADRYRLVQYMRTMRGTLHRALHQVLDGEAAPRDAPEEAPPDPVSGRADVQVPMPAPNVVEQTRAWPRG